MRTEVLVGLEHPQVRTTEDCQLGRQEGGSLEPWRKCSPLLLVGRRPGILPLGTRQLGVEAGS